MLSLKHRRSASWITILTTTALLLLPGCGVSADSDSAQDEVDVADDGVAVDEGPRFDQLTWLTAHNAFNNSQDAYWAVPNQSKGIRTQLDSGVRALMLDTHYWDPPSWLCTTSFGKDCYPKGVYLCHGDCGQFVGITFALPRQSLSGTMSTVLSFLKDNPTEIVTIFLEDYTSPSQLTEAFDQVPNLGDYIFNPSAPEWQVQAYGWPTVKAMVEANKRLLIFTDRWENRDIYGIAFGRDYTVENFWSIGNLGKNYDCVSRWDDIPLNTSSDSWNRLFVMNQFRDIPTQLTAATDNAYSNLQKRVDQYCSPAAGKLPNFVAVDFFDTSNGDAKRYVDDLTAAR
jgi:hypothetical protein